MVWNPQQKCTWHKYSGLVQMKHDSFWHNVTGGGGGNAGFWRRFWEGFQIVVEQRLANCPAAFLSYFHCGFVMKYSWQIQRTRWAIQVGWVGQFTRAGCAQNICLGDNRGRGIVKCFSFGVATESEGVRDCLWQKRKTRLDRRLLLWALCVPAPSAIWRFWRSLWPVCSHVHVRICVYIHSCVSVLFCICVCGCACVHVFICVRGLVWS